MPLELVLKLLRELISERMLAQELVVVWHSGEPLTLPQSYYANTIDAITDLCKREAPGISVSFDIQTNATLINDNWCDFFEQYASVINIGVSCDGTQVLHDAFRIDWKGSGTFERTLRGINTLDRRGIKYNVIAVVTRRTLENPDVFFDFFFQRRKALTDFHFNVLASPIDNDGDLNYGAEDRSSYYRFYRRLMELWEQKKLAGENFPIRNFSQALRRLAMHGLPDAPSYVRETSAPLRSLNMDTEGNLTTFYAGLDINTEVNRYGDGEGLALGNIKQQSLAEMLRSSKLKEMMLDFEHKQQQCAASCEYYSICPGGFEIVQMINDNNSQHTTIETVECIIHVKTLTDAMLDALETSDHVQVLTL